MKKTIILIAPSEGKITGGNLSLERVAYTLPKPLDIAVKATEKDLKCKGQRFKEGIALNKVVEEGPFMKAIERYSGVQFSALGYETLNNDQKERINTHVIICSGMYGLLSPLDSIANYKLPIGTKGLYSYWKEKCTLALKSENADRIINLLPGSYSKMFDRSKINAEPIQPLFYRLIDGEKKNLTHMVKKYRGLRLRGSAFQGEVLDGYDFNIADLE